MSVDTEPDSLDVSVDWDDVDGAADYLVRWRAAGPGNQLNDGVRATSSETGITVADYGEWVVRVEACNSAGCGSSTVRQFTVDSTSEPTPEPTPEPPTTAPAMPTGLSVDAEPDSLDVSVDWDDVDGAADYLVRWRSVVNGEKLNDGVRPTSSEANITVADYGEWVVRVEACNSAGCGPHLALRFEVEQSEEEPETVPESSPLVKPLFFPFVITSLVLERPGAIGDARLPEAEGGKGEFTYTLTGLPQGVSFDPDTRILSGRVSVGEYTLTYTATDEAGVKDVQTFTLVVGSTLSRSGAAGASQTRSGVQGSSEDINWQRPNVSNLSVDRRRSSEPTSPGLSVSWGAPDMSKNQSGDNLTWLSNNINSGTGRTAEAGLPMEP